PLFYQLPPSITTGHYHSWVADHEHLPDCFSVSAYDEYNNIMAIRHRELPLTAVQFHPESVLTPDGYKILSNWVNSVSYLCGEQQ
ncbi:MAG: hypothetical protein RQ866_06770, partial [Bacteroidales bacterium]|nr:hypothetical protein [Bacteroidales bacterium]